MRSFFYTIVLMLFCILGKAQRTDFYPPVSVPISLNGNFGEVRSNHFHAGIDIKTNGATGLPVYSIDDGYISRITVSASGYGNAIYIDHPSGYTSIYGHLDHFMPSIEQWVREQQYKQERFEVNLETQPDEYIFRVKKGDQIAYSGNTGNSGGPHVHLEMRKTNTQHPVNPLLNGFDIKDNFKPVAVNLYIYPVNDDSRVKSTDKKQKLGLIGQNGTYRLKDNGEIAVWGEIGFGVEAYDCSDGNGSKCGIYKLELRVDSVLISSFEMDEFSYEKMRQINSHIDYEAFANSGKIVQKAYMDPGNHLDIYKEKNQRGVFNFNDGRKHRVRISLYDAHNNQSNVVFTARSTQSNTLPPKKYTELFRYDRKNKFENDEVEIVVPEEALYADFGFNYSKLPKTKGIYSNIHRLHTNTVPLNKNAIVKIKATAVPEKLRNKAVICMINLSDQSLECLGGDYSFGWVEAEAKTFGNMCIAVDSVAPRIVPLGFTDKNTLIDPRQIKFKLTDNLSGIKYYNGYIDNKWVLFEYDLKSKTITYKIDEHIYKGNNHQLKIVAEDQKGNLREYSKSFYY